MQHSLENKYSDFSETDYINDLYFQSWIIHPTEAVDVFWNSYMHAHPEKTKTIEAAKAFLQNIRFAEDVPDDNHIHQLYLQHLDQVSAQKAGRSLSGYLKATWKFAAIAAVVTGMILFLATVFDTRKSAATQVVVATNFGEIKKVVLPDGSIIVLNGHSSVRFSNDWQEGAEREIWLNGEAFLDVKRTENKGSNGTSYEKFFVRGEGYTIEVLGTAFDVRQRRGKTEVVLQTGKIKLTLKDRQEPIILLPGDFVSYVPARKSIEKSTTVAENYSGWKEKKLQLNNPTLEEITNYLEDNYGKEIIIDTPAIKNKKIEGIIELSNLDDALFIISTVLNTDIERKGDRITIKSK
jgi:transmembrane sensor